MEEAIPTANGKLKYMNVAILNVIICASKAVVPNSPASMVVISNDHASAEMDSAPDIAIFQNGFNTEYCKFSFESRGHVA
mmetsp:Transcript_15156/g.21463  ORF Transcript_15156/g.21463 Transcript_15156/m.21463 type:complete len:80 (-) Transcript_15156:104-343(-)